MSCGGVATLYSAGLAWCGRDAKNFRRDAANAFRASGAQHVEDAKRKVIELIADIKDKAA